MAARWDVSPYQVIWVLVGLAVLVAVSFMVHETVGGILLGLFLYYGTRPVYHRVHDHVEHRNLSAALTLSTVGVPMFLVLGYAVLVGYQELAQVLDSPVSEDLRALLRPIVDPTVFTDRERWLELLSGNATILREYTTVLFAWGVRLFIMVTVAYYLLRDGPDAGRWFRKTFTEYDAVEFMEGVDSDLAHIYAGNMVTIAITGLLAAVTYYLFNFAVPGGRAIQYPILLGLLIGVGTLIPVLGMLAIYVPYTGFLVVMAVAWGAVPVWVPVAYFAITFVVIDAFPDFILRSYISKGDINMGLMILSYVVGAEAFGWYGVFLGPIVLVLFLHFSRRVFPALVEGWSVELVSE